MTYIVFSGTLSLTQPSCSTLSWYLIHSIPNAASSQCFRCLGLKENWPRLRRISYCSHRDSPSLLQGLRGKRRRRRKSLILSLMILCQNNIQRLPGMQLLAVNGFRITIITVNNNKFVTLYEFIIIIVSLLGLLIPVSLMTVPVSHVNANCCLPFVRKFINFVALYPFN